MVERRLRHRVDANSETRACGFARVARESRHHRMIDDVVHVVAQVAVHRLLMEGGDRERGALADGPFPVTGVACLTAARKPETSSET